MPVLASAATTVAVCTTALGNSPGLARSAQLGAAPTCCDVTALRMASAPQRIQSRLVRIVVPYMFCRRKHIARSDVKATREQERSLTSAGPYVLFCKTNASRRLSRLAGADRDARRHAPGVRRVRDDCPPRDRRTDGPRDFNRRGVCDARTARSQRLRQLLYRRTDGGAGRTRETAL